jgi:hypothetical protein
MIPMHTQNRAGSLTTVDPAARRQLFLSGILCALIGADAYVSRFVVLNELGREGNSFLQSWVVEPAFLFIKIGTALAASYLLWILYKRNARLVRSLTVTFVSVYSLIVWWNVSVAVSGLVLTHIG